MRETIKRLTSGLLGVAMLTACEVTNPGPVQDEFLAEEASQQGLINGAVRDIATSISGNTYTTAILAREIFPGGQTGSYGNSVTTQAGEVLPGSGPNFTSLHEARFIAETASKRFAEVGASANRQYQAALWAGIAYRLLGEWYCEAVLPSTDPDDTTPGMYETNVDGYFQRAEAAFTAALGFAATDAERHAALGGRAAARLWLENWAGALADANQVPDAFEFVSQADISEEALYNDLYEANSGPFRSYSVKFTFFEDYYATTGDPRTPWVVDPDYSVATASLSGFGAVPYLPQRKYPDRSADYRMISGWEMRLVEAEAILRGAGSGAFADAMTLINHVRTRNLSDIDDTPLAAVTAANATEAWTALKRERYVELWLEGRRLGDERRWGHAPGTQSAGYTPAPGALDTPTWNVTGSPGYTPLFVADSERSFCFDIPTSERDRNPNVPATSS